MDQPGALFSFPGLPDPANAYRGFANELYGPGGIFLRPPVENERTHLSLRTRGSLEDIGLPSNTLIVAEAWNDFESMREFHEDYASPLLKKLGLPLRPLDGPLLMGFGASNAFELTGLEQPYGVMHCWSSELFIEPKRFLNAAAHITNPPNGLAGLLAFLIEGTVITLEVWRDQASQRQAANDIIGPALRQLGIPSPTATCEVEVLALAFARHGFSFLEDPEA